MEHEAGEMFRAQLRTGPLRETGIQKERRWKQQHGRKYSNIQNEKMPRKVE